MKWSVPGRNALLAFLVLCAARESGAGVEMRWNRCSSPVTDYNVEPYSATVHELIVTLTGVEGDAGSLDFTIAAFDPCSSDGNYIPQAWRFDSGGCQDGALTIDRPASYDGCEGLVPLPGPSFANVTVGEIHTTIGQHNDPVTYPAIFIRIGQTFTPRHLVASERYVVARIRLDMGNTVAGADPAGKACGCGSAPRQIGLLQGMIDGALIYNNSGMIEDNAYWAGPDFCVIDRPAPPVTNWGADPACLTTESRAKSWGAIKAQYR